MTENLEKSVTTLHTAIGKAVLKPENQDARETLFSLLKNVHANSPHEAAGMTEDVPLPPPHLVVVVVEFALKKARENNWPLVRYLDGYYIYCGTHWKKLTDDDLKDFLGKCAEQIKVDRLMCRHFKFKDALLKQFFAEGYFNPPKPDQLVTKINLGNGTFHISTNSQTLLPYNSDDFMQYKLSFDYDPSAVCPKFDAYLNRVLPDKQKQMVLAEFIAYAFTKNSAMKFEKAAILFGSGSNGKSVFFDIILKLLGDDNVSNISLQALTDSKGYHRALLPGKLLNYASEISGNLDPTIFKQLVSGEPVEARQIYGKPFILKDYARMIFNTNTLPTDTEANHGFFRRFLLIHFDQTILEHEQDKNLAGYVIEHELSAVFNWVLDGLKRLLNQKGFSSCPAIENALKEYRKNSDSVNLFLEDGQYKKSTQSIISLKVLYNSYKDFCKDSGYQTCSLKSFSERLKTNHGLLIVRKSTGRIVHIEKVV